jgi:indolepyruvate ferredoxin oxidoreductase alpha subunit
MARLGHPHTRIPIEDVVKGLGVKHLVTVNPLKSKKLMETVKEAVDFKGVSVIISQEICPLYARTVEKKPKRAFYVSREKCKNDRECINKLGCPAFYLEEERVCINEDACIGCTLCAQLCPENAILPLRK